MLVRHGESEWNRENRFTGWTDVDLSEKGAQEALNAGNFNLAYKDSPGLNASGWAKMLYEFNSDEAVFVTLYNKVHDDNAAHEIYRNREG